MKQNNKTKQKKRKETKIRNKLTNSNLKMKNQTGNFSE